MASRTSLSLSSPESILSLSDMTTSTHPYNQSSSKTSLKIRFKLKPNHTSIAKVGVDDSAVIGETQINASSSYQKSPKISDDRFVAEKVGVDPSSIVKEGDVVGESNACKGETSLGAFVDQHQPAVPVINVSDAAKKNKKKRQFFSVTLPREEIEAYIAAIEALSGGKRLRRPRKRDFPRSQADQRRLDRLFPGLDCLGFH